MSWFALYLSVYGYVFCCMKFIATQAPSQELFSTVASNMLSCMSEMPENFSMDTCKEMLEKKDLTDEKYKPCKCLGFCTSKKIGVMNEDGTGNKDKLKAIVDGMDSKEWKQEGTTVLEKCANLPGQGCDLAVNFMKCAIDSSTMVKEFVKVIMGSAN